MKRFANYISNANCVVEMKGEQKSAAAIWLCNDLAEESFDIGFEDFVEITRQFLTHYPPDVFDGSSGDSGVLFVVGLRKLLTELEER